MSEIERLVAMLELTKDMEAEDTERLLACVATYYGCSFGAREAE